MPSAVLLTLFASLWLLQETQSRLPSSLEDLYELSNQLYDLPRDPADIFSDIDELKGELLLSASDICSAFEIVSALRNVDGDEQADDLESADYESFSPELDEVMHSIF